MKAIVFHDVGDIRLDDVPEPQIEKPGDALVRITTSAICGTDLHFIRGTVPGMKAGTILGHEGVGVVEEVGGDVRNLRPGERVVIPSTIACGWCSYCRAGYTSQCDEANPKGKLAGTAFYGGPEGSGSFHGMQAEFVRVPFASVGLVKLPDGVSDEQAILLSDIFPTGWFGADVAEVADGDAVAVFGCGPVGQFAIASARIQGAGRVFAVDSVASRLEMARAQGAEVVDFNAEDPVETIFRLTGGIGVDRAIDAVGVDAESPERGPAAASEKAKKEKEKERKSKSSKAAGNGGRDDGGGLWTPGDAPEQALEWAVQALAKAGTLSIIGVYPLTSRTFPIGEAVNKNLTMNMGNCPHRKYIPELLDLVQAGMVDPTKVLTNVEPLTSALRAYEEFDRREAGWVKVALEVEGEPEREEAAAGAGAETR